MRSSASLIGNGCCYTSQSKICGEYEYILKTHERLKLIIPFTLLIIFVIVIGRILEK